MKISIFPTVKPHPKKDEKREEAIKSSGPENAPVTALVADDMELSQLISTYAWSPIVFKPRTRRHSENFVSADFMVYDVDDGMTIEQADAKLLPTGFAYLIAPSPSHTPEAHRFRIVLPLSRTIYDKEVYEQTWQDGAVFLGNVDPSTCDLARLFFACKLTDGFYQDGTFLTPVFPEPKQKRSVGAGHTTLVPIDADFEDVVTALYGEPRTKIPEAVAHFITNAHTGLPGSWVTSLNACCFSLALSGVPEDTIRDVLEQLCPDQCFDKRDEVQVKRAIRDGANAREV